MSRSETKHLGSGSSIGRALANPKDLDGQVTSEDAPQSKVTQSPSEVTPRTGYRIFGITWLQQQTMEMLLQPNVKTYADAAKRLGCTEGAVKQRMSCVIEEVRSAKSVCNMYEDWKRKRRAHKKGTDKVRTTWR